ncbi:MAG: sensor domain-containing diguanylate cyclase [Deltaproteobacteria bacterium]|nr:sensor domain-containing diguanylate cyclase [Deltaproteobacteria bacterium]
MKQDATYYRRILDNLYDGVCIVDKSGQVTFWNKGAERLSGYRSEEVVGHRCTNDIALHMDKNGRRLCDCDDCPTMNCMRRRELIAEQVYIHHKEGYLIPTLTRVSPLVDSRGEVAGAVEIFSENKREVEAIKKIERLERMALLDPLTGIGNRRFCIMNIEAQLSAMKRYGWQFGLILSDLDFFKRINDDHGHNVGDRVLSAISQTLANGIRSSDVICRWGGEEFVAIVHQVGAAELCTTAEKLRRLVETARIKVDGKDISVTLSLGATLAKEDDSSDSLIERADLLMYRSKSEGRNRVSCFPGALQ